MTWEDARAHHKELDEAMDEISRHPAADEPLYRAVATLLYVVRWMVCDIEDEYQARYQEE